MSATRKSLAPPACLMVLALGGCVPSAELAVAPQVLSAEWQQQPETSNIAAPTSDSLGAALGAPELQGLLARAAAGNADVAASAARVSRARAQLGIARAAMLPVVTASAGISETRTDNRGGPVFNFSEGFAGLDVAYEIDLLGGAKAGRNSARARLVAAAFDLDALALVVETEVARAFVQHAALSDRIVLLDRNLAQARELERIIGARLRAGAATRVDLGLQTIQVRQLEAERLRLDEAMIRTRNAMAVLVGEEAPRFALPQSTLADLAVPDIALVQPGELLVRRPDIRAAEARIAAAEGDVRQARAAFLPRLRLSASALGQAATLAGPLGATFAIGADLLAPIFNRGRLRGNLGAAAATQAESVALYRGALLTALGEAENALTAVEQARAREGLLTEIVAEARTTAHLARRQYLEGDADLQRVLDAEQLLVRAEDARAVARQERIEAAIDLYKALGGNPQRESVRPAIALR
ncbi:efflux transporter outer membrane subunit [Allosphingosinicella sp.]|jgi:NodT family efflux transporter outer membrane factor (OMF) lipoprotein|uniref:efflux transporter outer membrane subunit n=1 Tax=Allosphingosinicella sp. TaxID=2823234 RepID=UPI002EE0C04D